MINKSTQKICIALSCLIASSCAVFQPKKNESVKPKQEKSASDIKPYSKVITDKAKTDEGLFNVHYLDKKYFYEIPDSILNREMLMVTRIAKTATGIGFGGGKQNTQVLRWQKKGDNILLE